MISVIDHMIRKPIRVFWDSGGGPVHPPGAPMTNPPLNWKNYHPKGICMDLTMEVYNRLFLMNVGVIRGALRFLLPLSSPLPPSNSI